MEAICLVRVDKYTVLEDKDYWSIDVVKRLFDVVHDTRELEMFETYAYLMKPKEWDVNVGNENGNDEEDYEEEEEDDDDDDEDDDDGDDENDEYDELDEEDEDDVNSRSKKEAEKKKRKRKKRKQRAYEKKWGGFIEQCRGDSLTRVQKQAKLQAELDKMQQHFTTLEHTFNELKHL
ncbi:hypothetical protein RFI_10289, partial [Reticulomyxa filosa]